MNVVEATAGGREVVRTIELKGRRSVQNFSQTSAAESATPNPAISMVGACPFPWGISEALLQLSFLYVTLFTQWWSCLKGPRCRHKRLDSTKPEVLGVVQRSDPGQISHPFCLRRSKWTSPESWGMTSRSRNIEEIRSYFTERFSR